MLQRGGGGGSAEPGKLFPNLLGSANSVKSGDSGTTPPVPESLGSGGGPQNPEIREPPPLFPNLWEWGSDPEMQRFRDSGRGGGGVRVRENPGTGRTGIREFRKRGGRDPRESRHRWYCYGRQIIYMTERLPGSFRCDPVVGTVCFLGRVSVMYIFWLPDQPPARPIALQPYRS